MSRKNMKGKKMENLGKEYEARTEGV